MYGASKAAVKSLAMHLGVELASYKIRVNSLSQGYIEKEMSRTAAEANPAMKDMFENAPPLGRRGQVSGLIGPAMWLLSDAGAWTTATDVLMTGGLHGGSTHLKLWTLRDEVLVVGLLHDTAFYIVFTCHSLSLSH
jgi:sorbose reductase